MPARGLKFITEFLLPNLNSQRFGTRLMWLNTKFSIFQVQWCHKSAADWTSYDAEVFMEWDKIKGRGLTDDKERFTKSKQRFRAIIYKLIKGNQISELCNDKGTKIYCLGMKESIPSEVIERALQSRESREKSSEKIYRCDPETVIDVCEISVGSFLIDNQTVTVMEDHKYANRLKEVAIESEDAVPSSEMEQFSDGGTKHMYINVWQTLPIKRSTTMKLEDSSLEDFTGSNLNFNLRSDDIRWEEIQGINLSDENTVQPEAFLSSCDKIEKYPCIDGNQLLSFSEVWNNSQL